MAAIAIVGAGPGLGMSIARLFGQQGFDIALISRDKAKHDALAADLESAGIPAAGFPADVLDRPSLAAALEQAAQRFGTIDVLEYSPADRSIEMVGALEATPETTQEQVEYYLYGAMAATAAVLPAMREAGAGTLLYTTGGGSVDPNPVMGSINAAQAALRNWVLNMHKALDGSGVLAAHVAISAWIGSGAPAAEPDAIAATYWDLHTARDRAEVHYTA